MLRCPSPRCAPRPLVEPQRLSGRIQWGCAPKPATEPMGFRGSCVKRFRKTFRPVFSNSVCVSAVDPWLSACIRFSCANSGLRGALGGLFGPLLGRLGRSWALLGGLWARRSIFKRFWMPFGTPFGGRKSSKMGSKLKQNLSMDSEGHFWSSGGLGGVVFGWFWGAFGARFSYLSGAASKKPEKHETL